MEIHGAKTGIKNLTGTELTGQSPDRSGRTRSDRPLSPEQEDWKNWTRNRLNLKKSFTIKISTLHNSSDVLHECKARYDSYSLFITNDSWRLIMTHLRWIMKKRLPLKNDWPRLVFILKLSDSLSIWRSLLIGWRIRNQFRNPDKLNGTLEEKHKTKKILDEQQRKLQVNLRRCQVEMEKCTREHDALNSKIEELELYDDSSQRELKRKRLNSRLSPFPVHFR